MNRGGIEIVDWLPGVAKAKFYFNKYHLKPYEQQKRPSSKDMNLPVC